MQVIPKNLPGKTFKKKLQRYCLQICLQIFTVYYRMTFSWCGMFQAAPVSSIATFKSFAKKWINEGVNIIGGCCGLSPNHIKEIAQLK